MFRVSVCCVQGMILFGIQLMHDKAQSPLPHAVSLSSPVKYLQGSGSSSTSAEEKQEEQRDPPQLTHPL